MVHIRADGSSGKVEHRVDRDAEAAQLLLDAAQSCFHAASTVPDVPEGGLEDLDPVAPFVPFLHAEQDLVHVDHRRGTGEGGNQPFDGRARLPSPHV